MADSAGFTLGHGDGASWITKEEPSTLELLFDVLMRPTTIELIVHRNDDGTLACIEEPS